MEFERLREIISDVLSVGEEEITEETRFIDDLGADSLDIFQIIMTIEDETGVEIPQEAAEKIITIGDALQYIKDQKG